MTSQKPARMVGSMNRRNRRTAVQLSQPEADQLLREHVGAMSCATVNPDGSVHLVAMSYAFLDRQLIMTTKAASQKIKNLRRDARMTCLVEEGLNYEELRGVQLLCTTEIVEDPAYVVSAGTEIMHRNMNIDYADIDRDLVRRTMNKRVAVRIAPVKYVTWDHRKLFTASG
jgi:Pyridoxamine 5'-phosphate oxidase